MRCQKTDRQTQSEKKILPFKIKNLVIISTNLSLKFHFEHRVKQEQVIGTYVYSQKHNYIPYSTFTITTVQLHVSTINVGHLQVVREAPYDKLYLYISGGTVYGVGWVRDLVLCL